LDIFRKALSKSDVSSAVVMLQMLAHGLPCVSKMQAARFGRISSR